ncbi:MAG: putative transcriptional regulator of viral defense system [Glaciecola sp.]|jgi:predicted transcriptional regulator of viral defense system
MVRKLDWEIFKLFSSAGDEVFTYHNVLDEFQDLSSKHITKVLTQMIEKGMLLRLKRNLYTIIPTYADASNYIPDWHLVAKHLMKDKKYYIGYYSAMQIHNLITQPSLKEIIVTNKQLTSVTNSIKIIQGVKFQFVTQSDKSFFGIKNMFINNHDKVMVSDLEKTIVDACTKPHLSGGIVEIAKAIYETRNKVNLQKLLGYLITNDSNAAIKRYLFICDLVEVKWTAYHEGMKSKEDGNSYPLLDTSAPDEGYKDSSFGLKINVDINTIQNSIYT